MCPVSCHQSSHPDHHAVAAAAVVAVVAVVAAVGSVDYLRTECLLFHTCCAHLTVLLLAKSPLPPTSRPIQIPAPTMLKNIKYVGKIQTR